jgi:ferric-dicitrate binding protein FerR (iron transport regulator)
MKKFILVFLLATFLSAENAGKLIAFSGQVTLTKVGTKESLVLKNKNSSLSYGDVLVTSKGAKAQIELQNGESILLKENTRLELGGKATKNRMIIDAGEFLIGLKKKLGKDESFEVVTPACVTGVRGTVFWGLSDADKSSTYAALDHDIEIKAAGKSLILKPGQKIKIEFGKAPGLAEEAKVPLSFIDTFEIDGQVQGIKELLK